MNPVTVACVLRSGGPYDASYVARLRVGVANHLSIPHRFVCLSDVPVPCERIPLETEWPANFAKLELFRPGLFDGSVLFLDLDTDVIGDLTDIATLDTDFAMIDDWLVPNYGASGVMVFRETNQTRLMHESWSRTFPAVLDNYRRDQVYIHRSVEWEPLRQLLPGQIVSRWIECLQAVPEDARLVCWHGSPRPHEIDWQPTGGLELRHESWREKVERIQASA